MVRILLYSVANCRLMAKNIIINVGRQFGSGGKSVAVALGEKLGIPVYDSELISRTAQESGLSSSVFTSGDEDRKTFRLGLAHGFFSRFGGQTHDGFGDAELFNIQSQTIRNIAEAGSAVIVGRCADYVLRDLDNTLDVFITAPQARRVERVCARTGLDAAKAQNLIVKKDRNRESYYNCYTFGNWGVADNYDLCIDSSILGIDGTADFIIDFARKAGLLDE